MSEMCKRCGVPEYECAQYRGGMCPGLSTGELQATNATLERIGWLAIVERDINEGVCSALKQALRRAEGEVGAMRTSLAYLIVAIDAKTKSPKATIPRAAFDDAIESGRAALATGAGARVAAEREAARAFGGLRRAHLRLPPLVVALQHLGVLVRERRCRRSLRSLGSAGASAVGAIAGPSLPNRKQPPKLPAPRRQRTARRTSPRSWACRSTSMRRATEPSTKSERSEVFELAER